VKGFPWCGRSPSKPGLWVVARSRSTTERICRVDCSVPERSLPRTVPLR